MKRNENFILVSRDHHYLLLFCWKIRQGIKKEIAIDRIVKYIDFFWQNTLKAHYFEEEEFLFLHEDDLQCDLSIASHRRAEEMIYNILTNAVGYTECVALADFVDKQVRFEERELFPYLEQKFTTEELDNVGKHIAASHTIPNDNYEDEFWIDKK